MQLNKNQRADLKTFFSLKRSTKGRKAIDSVFRVLVDPRFREAMNRCQKFKELLDGIDE